MLNEDFHSDMEGLVYGIRYVPPRSHILKGLVMLTFGWFFPQIQKEGEPACYIDYWIDANDKIIIGFDCGYGKIQLTQ